MLIFVYEFTCATAYRSFTKHDALRTEGWAMLNAVMDDFSLIPGVEVAAILSRDMGTSNRRFHAVDPGEEEFAFREFAKNADFTLVIAPECDDILARRCQWVTEVGGRFLGSSLSSIRLAADKCALAHHLKRHGVPTPDCELLTSEIPRFPAVLKPRCGAGSLDTFLLREEEDWVRFRGESQGKDMIIQQFVSGNAASVAFLVGPQQRLALPAASQVISDDGRIHYLGGHVPLCDDLMTRAQCLADRAVKCVPGMNGYVGVDLVLGSNPDGGEDWVIEINPRLTTSYIGLRALAEFNLAQTLLNLALGREIWLPKWRPGQVRFFPDGKFSRI
jgi:predicted ATP-grasp superfamily ATP-dependent carboligase